MGRIQYRNCKLTAGHWTSIRVGPTEAARYKNFAKSVFLFRAFSETISNSKCDVIKLFSTKRSGCGAKQPKATFCTVYVLRLQRYARQFYSSSFSSSVADECGVRNVHDTWWRVRTLQTLALLCPWSVREQPNAVRAVLVQDRQVSS